MKASLACSLLLMLANRSSAAEQIFRYEFSGNISSVSRNEGLIQDLSIGDEFTGYFEFESHGSFHGPGSVFVHLNGKDLLYRYCRTMGRSRILTDKSFRLDLAPQAPFPGADVKDSSFLGNNFGVHLRDTDGSAGYSTYLPADFAMSEFEVNLFTIQGTDAETRQVLLAAGPLSSMRLVPEPHLSCGMWLVLTWLLFARRSVQTRALGHLALTNLELACRAFGGALRTQ